MPSIYLTAHNSAEAIPLFKKKNISHLMPGEVGRTAVTIDDGGSPFFYPIHFLQMVIMAIATHAVAELVQGFRNVFKDIPLAHSFEIPVCTFRFAKLTPEEVTNLKSMGLTQDLTNGNLFVGTPQASHLPILMKMNRVDDRLRPGFVNAAGFLTYVYLMKGIAAFITARNNTDGRANMRYSLKTSVKFDKEGDVMRVGKDIFKGKHGFSSGRSIVTSNDIFIHPPEVNMSTFPGNTVQLNDAKAMPQSTTGFFFPYFRGLNQPSKSYATDTFKRFFPNLVGKDFQQNATVMGLISAGGSSLSYSYSGMAIAHIYRCLALSMELEDASISILVKGSAYLGVMIATRPGIKLQMYGRSYEAGPIGEEVRKVDLLESQSEKICEILNTGAMDVDGMVKKQYQPVDFLSSRRALRSWNNIQREQFTASDILDQVREVLLEMDFNDSFPPLSVENLKICITAMQTKDFGALQPYPAFLSKVTLMNRSPLAESLSMFGPMAPTFNPSARGVVINIPGADKADANLVKVEGVRPLHYLPFWSVPIAQAITQWERAISGGGFTLPGPRKNKKEFTDLHKVVLQVGSDADLSQIYNGIKSMVESSRVAAKAGLKRGRDGEDVGSTKRVKVRDSDLDDAF